MVTVLHKPVVLNILGLAMLVLCLVAVADVFYVPFAEVRSGPRPNEQLVWQYTQRSAPDFALDLPGSDGDGLRGPLVARAMPGTATATTIDLSTGEWWIS